MRNVLREGDGRVSFAELFYDLVFVFAITQASHHLLKHFTLEGALHSAFLFLSIWWVWIYSTWVLNRLDPEKVPVRVLLFSMMTGGLFLSMALPEAFGSRGWIYGLCFAALQIGRSLFVIAVSGATTRVRSTFCRIAAWVSLAGIFWVWGGFAAPEDRAILWLVALGIELAAPILGYPVPGFGREVTSNWDIHGGHMAERCGLFVIICLGETLLVSGATFAEMVWDGTGVVTFLSAVIGAIGMWWVYFHVGHKRGTHHIEHASDPGALGRLAYTYLHIPIVAGVVLGAVGSELAIAHPLHHAQWGQAASILGGVALFLIGNGFFKWVSSPNFPLSHLVGIALCALAAGLTPFTNLMVLNIAAMAILIIVAVWEDVSLNQRPARRKHP